MAQKCKISAAKGVQGHKTWKHTKSLAFWQCGRACRKQLSVYGIWYCPLLQASFGGLGMCPLWIRGDDCSLGGYNTLPHHFAEAEGISLRGWAGRDVGKRAWGWAINVTTCVHALLVPLTGGIQPHHAVADLWAGPFCLGSGIDIFLPPGRGLREQDVTIRGCHKRRVSVPELSFLLCFHQHWRVHARTGHIFLFGSSSWLTWACKHKNRKGGGCSAMVASVSLPPGPLEQWVHGAVLADPDLKRCTLRDTILSLSLSSVMPVQNRRLLPVQGWLS